MSFLLAVLAQTATPVAAPYPVVPVLDAFAKACENIQDIKRVEADLIAQQWTAEIPAEDSPLGQLLAVGRAGAAKILDGPDDKMSDMVVYTKTVSGERLDIIISQVQSSGTVVNGCRLYDVEETRQINLADAQKWIGREADKTRASDAISIANWTPGYHEGHDSFEIFYVPAGSPIIALTKFNGIALKADFVGETE